ncbi:phospholipase A2 inhibitor and Ly6/PLAUR domain-containing protein-like [Notechis scutatus]|uniref:Phospholipase A2 inhibitor and Ly6/PLAUR domain-containing protein-like n=1 Tax=Notechis scutatus TaxID=8663 RepID=A0A6J1V1U1_9SAUR|nr:phospholipase A2 inhibitor and Ly6/PLAUR domain-containing protein-like [Notechis scutatus]
MKYLLFSAALIATATAELICQCNTPTSGPPCDKDKDTCTIQEGQCYSVERGISIEKEKTVNATSKGCQDIKGDVCNEGLVFISSENAFYLLSNIKCCKDKNQCNQNDAPKLPSFSEVNKTLSSKKLVCPSCFAYKNKTCEGEQMYCKENQDKCFTISGTVTTGSTAAEEFAAKGCATSKTILKVNTTLTFGENSYKLENVQVEEAKSGASWISNCLSFAILLPSVLWFLLDSSLY